MNLEIKLKVLESEYKRRGIEIKELIQYRDLYLEMYLDLDKKTKKLCGGIK